MGRRKFSDEELLRVMRECGNRQVEAARVLGVSEGTISKRVAKIRDKLNKEVAICEADSMADLIRNEVGQLGKLFVESQQFYDLVKTALHAEPGDKEGYDAKTKLRSLVGAKGSTASFLVSILAELRKQIEFYFNMRKEWLQMEKVLEFQKTVMETIQQENPETAARIVARLKEIQAIRAATDVGVSPEGYN